MRISHLSSAIFCAALGVTLPAGALAKCAHPPIPWKFGHSIATTWRTNEGSVCQSTSTRPEHISKIEITSKPRHGTAGKDGPYGVAYKPDSGFKGSDTFVYVVTSNSNYRKGAGRVAKVTVLVVVE